MKILAIETSCDETAVAITVMKDGQISVLANVVATQIELHAQFGGIVPNLAAREHERAIVPTVTEALQIAQITKDDIDAIAVTHGPGLIPALIIGVTAAKTLSYIWQKPLIGIHHLEGHIYANAIDNPDFLQPQTFPLLALIVSGGHTQLVLMRDHLQYEIIGETQDDAVGEAFDKVARMLGLTYPGGPEISRLADEYFAQNQKHQFNDKILDKFQLKELPRPMKHAKNYDFSFSGIKTSVLYKIKDFRKLRNLSPTDPLPADFATAIAAAFQEAVCDVLIYKTIKAAQNFNIQTITIAGGVSANTQLRAQLATTITNKLPQTKYQIPQLKYCLDNAAMIATAAHIRLNHTNKTQPQNPTTNWRTLDAHAQMELELELE